MLLLILQGDSHRNRDRVDSWSNSFWTDDVAGFEGVWLDDLVD